MIEELKQIARAAGEAILAIYNSDQIEVEQKADSSPLTRADHAANQLICTALAQMLIQYPVISEENKIIPYEVRKNWTNYWLVDPLDGTKEFIKKNGEFTVNIALIADGEPILSVVFAPVKDEMYWAEKKKGAYFQHAAEEPKQIWADEFYWQMPQLRVVASRSHADAGTAAFIQSLDNPVCKSVGSSLKFLLIAAAQADIYPRLAPTMEWDTAAAQLIVEEAGGQVLDWESRKPLRYNKPELLNPFFIVMGKLKKEH